MSPDDDRSPLGADDEVPEQPMVIAWEVLDPDAYSTTLQELAAWVDWLVATYEPPTQVVPPCWYAHPAQLEELGHLWTGWLITRHPLSGVGMIGLDWDTRREHTFQRLRETVAATGCNARNHNPPTPTMPRTNGDGLQQHLKVSGLARRAAHDIAIRRAAAAEVLAQSELRHNHAPSVLRQVTAEPAAPSDQDRRLAVRFLRDSTQNAVARAQGAAESALATPGGDGPEVQLRRAREELIAAIAQGLAPSDLDGLGRRWIDALEALVPAEEAIGRAVSAAAARQSAAGRLAASDQHPGTHRVIRGQDTDSDI